MLPAYAAGTYRVAQAELTTMFRRSSGSTSVFAWRHPLEFTADASQVAVDPATMNLVERVTAFKLQTRALDEAAAGNLPGATQKLRSAATRLLDLGELELADTANRAAAAIEQGQTPSAADQKAMTYKTRRLSLDELTGKQ